MALVNWNPTAPGALAGDLVDWNRNGAAVQMLQVASPAVSFLNADAGETATLEGTGGSTGSGCWFTVGTEYFYLTHDDGSGTFTGPDPGIDETALSGFTGISVPLAAGNRTDVQVATSIETAAGASAFSVVRTGANLTFTGDFVANDATTGGTWINRGSSSGAIGCTTLTPQGNFGLTTFRLHQIDPSRLSSTGPRRIVGLKLWFSGGVANPYRLGLYSGGAADLDPDGAVLLSEVVITGNGGTFNWSNVYFPESQIARVDTSTDRLFVAIQGDPAGSAIAAENIVTEASAQASHFFRSGSNQVLMIYNSPTGSGTSMPDPIVGSPASFNSFVVGIQLIEQEAPFYGDAAWRTFFGPTPGRNDSFASVSNMVDVWVRWAFHAPNVDSLRMYDVAVNLAAHGAVDGTQEIRLQSWETIELNGLFDIDGETIHNDWGVTSGTATGWNVISVAGGVPMTASVQYGLSIHSDGGDGVPGDTTLAFRGGLLPTQDTDPAGWGGDGVTATRMAITETEIDDPADTGVPHDENTPTPSPIVTSTIQQNPGNTGGVYAFVGHNGFVLTPVA